MTGDDNIEDYLNVAPLYLDHKVELSISTSFTL